jgi:hypothetical protein
MQEHHKIGEYCTIYFQYPTLYIEGPETIMRELCQSKADRESPPGIKHYELFKRGD